MVLKSLAVAGAGLAIVLLLVKGGILGLGGGKPDANESVQEPPQASPKPQEPDGDRPEHDEPAPAENRSEEISSVPSDPASAVRKLIAEDRFKEARLRLAREYFSKTAAPEQRNALEPLMLQISRRLIVEAPTDSDFAFYTVQPGDSLIKIAQSYRSQPGFEHVSYGILKLMNGLNRNLIRVGQKLRIPRGEVAVVVRKSQFKLYIFYEGIAFKAFPIAIGAEADSTPEGVYRMGGKTAKPTWWPPESTGLQGPIPYGDPRNPLGSHWIALYHDLHSGLGIHGTNDPDSIGTRASLGCIRMKNEDVQLLFAVTLEGMKCYIFE